MFLISIKSYLERRVNCNEDYKTSKARVVKSYLERRVNCNEDYKTSKARVVKSYLERKVNYNYIVALYPFANAK